MEGPRHLGAAYPADRAAALAGVPRSTLYHWASTELIVPTVSSTKVKRWSYSDLLLLRLVEWLRKDKPSLELPRTSMQEIRRALDAVQDLGERIRQERLRVLVDRSGGLVFGADEQMYVPLGKKLMQGVLETEVDLISAFSVAPDILGPDLAEPRPTLRIVPGKLSGEPHVADTRIPTKMLAALGERGFDASRIVELYPDLTLPEVADAIDLEEQLHRNLTRRAA